MPSPIPEMIKSQVITQWLQGLSRDAIAQLNKISAGAVSNIINEWMNALGKPEANALRELAKSLKILGLSPVQCAIGSRIMKLLTEQGIDAETAEHFITNIFKKCENLRVTPIQIVTYIEDIMKFSDRIPLSEFENYLNQKVFEKSQVEIELQEVKGQVSTLKEQKSEIERSRDLALEQKRKATQDMSSFFAAKQELDKHGISITGDLTKFANTVKCVADCGYDPKKVLAEFKDIQYLSGKRRALEIATDEKEKHLVKQGQQDDLLRHHINSHSEILSLFKVLANIGIGAKELRVLINLMQNITMSNGIDYWLAAGKFFEDIGNQYDPKLGFESKIEELKSEIEILKEKREQELQKLKNQHLVGLVVTKLLQDLSLEDILKLGQSYIGLLKGTFSLDDLSKGMIKTIEMVTAPSPATTATTTSTIKTTRDDKLTQILTKTRNELSELGFNNQPSV